MIGRFVVSKAGHDKDTVYVVVAAGADYLYLADGRLKKAEAPKKKKIRHVRLTGQYVEGELLEALERKEENLNDKIRYAIKQYITQNQ